MPAVTREFEIDAPIEDVWEFFLTPEELAPCIPGCQSVERIEEDVFEAEVAVKVGYTNLTFGVHAEITDKEPPNSLTVEASAEPTGRMPGSATVDGDLDMHAVDDDTTAGEMTIEFAIRGRLGSLGESAFKHKCAQMTEEFIANVTAELESQEETTAE